MGKHEKKSKKKSKKHKKERRRSTSSSSSSVSDEWVEKDLPKKTENLNVSNVQNQNERDEWMSLPTLFATASNSDRKKEREEAKRKEKELSTYDPSKSTRELNPYWKSGGDGLPSLNQQKMKFMKPEEGGQSYSSSFNRNRYRSSGSSWRKKSPESQDRRYGSEDRRENWKKRTDRYSPDSHRRRSPEGGRRRSPDRRSPEAGRSSDRLSPEAGKSSDRRSPDSYRRSSQQGERRRSPDPYKRRSPEEERRRSPDFRRRRSPEAERRRSPDSYKRRSPEAGRRRSPEKIRDKVIYDASSSDIIYTNQDSPPSTKPTESTEENEATLTDKEMNDIAAKIVKAEILGNTEKIAELKAKLERARESRKHGKTTTSQEENVLLFRTDSKGFSKPLDAPETSSDFNKRKKKIETHDSGKRQKYYADDDKYNLKQMFEKERFATNAQQDAEFIKLTAKASKMDDLDDIFMDKIRNEKSNEKKFQKERDEAIREHQKMTQSLDNCQYCLQSTQMQKHLMVSLGETAYLSLPPHEPLTDGHCLIIPTRHVNCSTQLDENEWTEISDIRKALTNMFLSQDEDVIFYETVLNAHSYGHMILNCVPVPKEQGDLAPIYFKKAIDECETEWTTNKKLINLNGKDVRRCVPKGLPYFFVSFGMNEGFAHVIEDQRYFPKFFAAEIIGGILDLHHSKWRKQQNEKFDKQKMRVLDFSEKWKQYDCTNKT